MAIRTRIIQTRLARPKPIICYTCQLPITNKTCVATTQSRSGSKGKHRHNKCAKKVGVI